MAQIFDQRTPQVVSIAVSTNKNRIIYFLIPSIIFAFAGQFLLLRTNGDDPREGLIQVIAGGLLILGAILFGMCVTPSAGLASRLEFPTEKAHQLAFTWRKLWTLSWIAASIVFATIDIILFRKYGESTTVVLIWMASILFLFIGSVGSVPIGRSHNLSSDWIYKVILVGLIAVALVMRIYKLTTLPYNLDGDFASVGLQARALATGQQHNIFAYGWASVPVLGYLPPWLTMKLFGDGVAGLNASGVVEGLLIILGVYLLGRDLFHARLGLMAAALLTISYAHLAASRQSSYIDPVVFLVYAISFLLIGLRESRGWAIVTSGILTALCIQMYYSGRIVVFIAGFIILYLLIFHWPWLKASRWTISLWFLTLLITLGPMLVVFAQHSDGFISRAREVFILNPEIIKHMQSVYRVNTLPAMLLQQARHTVLIFHYYPDTGTQFGFRRPFLDPFSATLFTLGVGYALLHWRQFGNSLILAWAILGVLIGCFLTANPPFWARLMILLPATVLLAALALDLIYEQLRRGLQSIRSRAIWVAPALIALLISIAGILNWNTYIDLKGTYATPRTRIGRYLADQPFSTQAYLVSSDFTYHDREFEFLAPERITANLTPEQFDSATTFLDPSKLIILTPEHTDLIDLLQQIFPNGTVEKHIGNSPNEVAFYVFRIH